MTAAEYRQALDALPYGKRLPGAVYLIDPGDDGPVPSMLRSTVAELRKRLEIGPEFNLLKFHTASPKISFLAYPDFEKLPHPALVEAVIVDLISGKIRRDDYRGRANLPILHRKETFLPPDHPLHSKFAKLTRQDEAAGFHCHLALHQVGSYVLLMSAPQKPVRSIPLPHPDDIAARRALAAMPPAPIERVLQQAASSRRWNSDQPRGSRAKPLLKSHAEAVAQMQRFRKVINESASDA